MDQILLVTKFQFHSSYSEGRVWCYLAPQLIRTKHAALCLHLHIKYSRRVKVKAIKESCWKSTCVVWIILLAMLYLSLSHFDIIPFHHTENVSCVLFTYKWNPQCLNAEHAGHLLASTTWCLNNWSRTEPSLSSSFQKWLEHMTQYVHFRARLLGILFYCFESVYLLMTWWLFSFLLMRR